MDKLKIESTLTTGELERWGTVRQPLSSPASGVKGVRTVVDGFESANAGIWECTPGTFRRALFNTEFMHILGGRCTFTPDGDEPICLQGGDTFLLAKPVPGVWDVLETVRKVYVVLD
jgi:uncharacterized cupin superfamily protein